MFYRKLREYLSFPAQQFKKMEIEEAVWVFFVLIMVLNNVDRSFISLEQSD